MIPVGFNIDVNEKTLLIAAGIVVVAIWYSRRQIETVAAAVNPVSADNVFNQAVTATGAAVSGDPGWTLGGWVYDLGHDSDTNEANPLGTLTDILTGVK